MMVQVPIILLLLAGAAYCILHRGTDWPGMLIGVALGVYGKDTWIGSVVRAVFDGITHGVTHIGHK